MSNNPSAAQNDLLDNLLGDFLDESDQLLTQLNERMLQLDEWVHTLGDDQHHPCDATLLNEMFRAAHSLKGLSAMFGLSDINNLTHKIENIFDAARKNELNVNGDVTELVFMGLDQVTALVGQLKEPGGDPIDCTPVLDSIRGLLQSAGVEKKQSSQADAERALSAIAAEVVAPTAPSAPAPVADTAPIEAVASAEAAPAADSLADVRDEEGIPEKYLAMFIDESEAALDDLTTALLSLDEGHAAQSLQRLMAVAHKIKGSAASIGLNRIAKLSHAMEDLLEERIAQKAGLSDGMTDALLRCTDALQRRLRALKEGTTGDDRFGELACDLLVLRNDSGRATGAPVTYAGEVRFEPDLPAVGLKAQLVYEKLSKLGAVTDCSPTAERFDSCDTLDALRFRLTTSEPLAAIRDRIRVSGVKRVHLEPFVPAAAQPVSKQLAPSATPMRPEQAAAPAAPIAASKTEPAPVANQQKSPAADEAPRTVDCGQRPTETIRVDIERLDSLMDLAGQLVINRAQFSQLGDKLRGALSGKQSGPALNRLSAELQRMSERLAASTEENSTAIVDAFRGHVRRLQNELEPLRREVPLLHRAHDLVEDLFEAIHQLGRVSDGIQQSVMDTRMVPIGPLFSRFKRVVRDITRQNGKEARLEIHGENTELDKRMIDELGDPLVHMVRNSVDHGIESPEVRLAAGKPREGTVTLEAFHRGNSIVIEVRDDGKGLDADRILCKCLEKGLVTKAEAEKLTTQQIYQKIWEPGLSTAEKVTEVSGRGMGMDIVKSKIDDLSGKVEITSVPGQGTTITVKLPLTLAILPSLMVEIGGDVFAVPMEAVVEIINVGRAQVNSVQGRKMATVRDRVVSLLKLTDLLAFHGRELATPAASDETTLVIVGAAGEEVGIAVDRVLGEEDVVIKSIAENFGNIRGIAGASILGDGRVSLILDIANLVDILQG